MKLPSFLSLDRAPPGAAIPQTVRGGHGPANAAAEADQDMDVLSMPEPGAAGATTWLPPETFAEVIARREPLVRDDAASDAASDSASHTDLPGSIGAGSAAPIDLPAFLQVLPKAGAAVAVAAGREPIMAAAVRRLADAKPIVEAAVSSRPASRQTDASLRLPSFLVGEAPRGADGGMTARSTRGSDVPPQADEAVRTVVTETTVTADRSAVPVILTAPASNAPVPGPVGDPVADLRPRPAEATAPSPPPDPRRTPSTARERPSIDGVAGRVGVDDRPGSEVAPATDQPITASAAIEVPQQGVPPQRAGLPAPSALGAEPRSQRSTQGSPPVGRIVSLVGIVTQSVSEVVSATVQPRGAPDVAAAVAPRMPRVAADIGVLADRAFEAAMGKAPAASIPAIGSVGPPYGSAPARMEAGPVPRSLSPTSSTAEVRSSAPEPLPIGSPRITLRATDNGPSKAASTPLPETAKPPTEDKPTRVSHPITAVFIAADPAAAPVPGPTATVPGLGLQAMSPAMNVAPDAPREPVGSDAWQDQLGAQLTVMASGGGEVEAVMKLAPEELGELEIRVVVRDGEAALQFGATNADARQAIEAAQPRLRELFASQGMAISNFSVFNTLSGNPQSNSRSGESPPRSSRTGSTARAEMEMRVTARDAQGIVDLYA